MTQTFTTVYFSSLSMLALIVCIGWYKFGIMNSQAVMVKSPAQVNVPTRRRVIFRRRDNAVLLHLGNLAILVKLPVDVFRTIETYLQAANRQHASLESPLFTGCTKGDHSTSQGISDKLIERVVKQYAPGGIVITPHGLRASFVTIALESGAKLHQVQYAAGHADPRTTERYQKRKVNLDDNGVCPWLEQKVGIGK